MRVDRSIVALGGTIALGCVEWIAPGRTSPPASAAALAILTFGFPHGALDIPLLARATPARRAFAAVLGVYILLALGVVAVAWVFPQAFFVGFVVLAVAHFAHDLDPAGRAIGIAYAGAPILLPNLFHAGPMETLVGALAGPELAQLWVRATGAAAGPWLIGSAFALLLPTRASGAARRDFAATVLAYTLLDPLLALTLHFCLVHAPRGTAHTSLDLGPRLARLWSRRTLAGGTVLLLAGGIALATSRAPAPWLWHAVVIALAALTLPHVLLAEWVAQRRSPVEGLEPSAT